MSAARHYHIVQNTPGYIPEQDVYCVDGRRAAIAAVSEEIRQYTESDIAYEGAEFVTHYHYCRPGCTRQHPTYRVNRSTDRLSASIEDRSKAVPSSMGSDLGYYIGAELSETAGCDLQDDPDQEIYTGEDY